MSTRWDRPMRRELLAFWLASVLVLALAALPWLSRSGTALADAGAQQDLTAAADARLLAWVLAWNFHAATTQPLHWFDANIFHPARNMLASSESLLGLLPLSLPISALTGNAVLAANLVAWLTYSATAVAMYAYLRLARLPWSASAVGAVLFCFGPFRLPGDIRVLQLPAFFLPLVSIAVQTCRPGRRAWLPIVTLLALTSSLYMAAMSAFVLLIELAIALRTRGSRETVWIVASILPIVPLLALAQWPYVRQASVVPATLDPLLRADVVAAASWHLFLYEPLAWRRTIAVACVLGLLGALVPLLRRDRPDTTWWRSLALFLVGLVIAAGPSLHVLGHDVPLPLQLFAGTPLAALRAFPRFLVLASMGLCGFAAVGAAHVVAAVGTLAATRWLTRLTVVALLLAAAVPGVGALYASPLSVVVLDEHPDVDRILAASDGAVLEIPPPLPGKFIKQTFSQANFMLRSTRHWRPLVNGHTGYTPWWHPALLSELQHLPDVSSLEAVSELTALEWIVVHRDLVAPGDWIAWTELPGRVPWLRVVLEHDGILVLHVERDRRTRWADALALGARFRGHTALGTPLRPLDPADAWAKLTWRFRPPRHVAPGGRVTGVLRVRNVGLAPWPALLRPEDADRNLVVLEGSWSGSAGRSAGTPVRIRLPRDVLPGDRVDVPFDVPAPDEPGAWTLAWRARQVHGAPFVLSPAASVQVDVRPG